MDVKTSAEKLRVLGNYQSRSAVRRCRYFAPSLRSHYRPASYQCGGRCRAWVRPIPSPSPTYPTSGFCATFTRTILQRCASGDRADIRLNAYPGQGFHRAYRQHMVRCSIPRFARQKCASRCANPGGLMRVGMFATATFHGQRRETVCRRSGDRDLASARPRLGLRAGRTTRNSDGWRSMPAKCFPATCRRSLSGIAPGQQVVAQCPGIPEHGGTVMIRSAGRFRSEQSLYRSRRGGGSFRVGHRFVQEIAGGSLPRCCEHLGAGDYAMAGPRGGGGGATSHHSRLKSR